MAKNDSTLTQSRLKELYSYDGESGTFTRLKTVGGRWLAGAVVGAKNSSGYIQIRIDGGRYLAHRLAFFYANGSWPIGEIDHIDGEKRNNKLSNLRDVTHSENMQNQLVAHGRTKSNRLGAHYQSRSNKWLAQIVLSGNLVHLGSFDTPELAHEAYLLAKRQLHSTCTI